MNVFEYEDYKIYTEAWVESRSGGKRGGWKLIAENLNVSTTLISQVFSDDSERDLTPDQAFDLSVYLGHSDLEQEYFLTLVSHARAGSLRHKNYHRDALKRLRKSAVDLKSIAKKDIELTEEAIGLLYSNWFFLATWVLSSIPQYQNFEKISEALNLGRSKTRKTIDELVRYGLCEEDKKTGEVKIGPTTLHLESDSIHISRHHGNWRERAIARAPFLTDEELMISAPLSISKKDLEKLRFKAKDFVRELGELVHCSDPELAVCFNLDLFRIADLSDED